VFAESRSSICLDTKEAKNQGLPMPGLKINKAIFPIATQAARISMFDSGVAPFSRRANPFVIFLRQAYDAGFSGKLKDSMKNSIFNDFAFLLKN